MLATSSAVSSSQSGCDGSAINPQVDDWCMATGVTPSHLASGTVHDSPYLTANDQGRKLRLGGGDGFWGFENRGWCEPSVEQEGICYMKICLVCLSYFIDIS